MTVNGNRPDIERLRDRAEEGPLRLWVALLSAFIVMAASANAPAQQKGASHSRSQEADWRTEVDEICSFADGSMGMTREELEGLLHRSRVLEPRIEGLPETQKKVYGRRLRMCRDLYQFVLEQKTSGATERNDGGEDGVGRRKTE